MIILQLFFFMMAIFGGWLIGKAVVIKTTENVNLFNVVLLTQKQALNIGAVCWISSGFLYILTV